MQFTYDEALEYIHGLYWRGKKSGLEKTKELLELIGHPERELSFVHIAGTNGKGSTAVMLASVLEEAGYRTGLYTSPYIMRYNERIQVNREEIPDERLAGLVSYLSEYAERMEVPPSEFEFGTVLAFLYFQEMKCDIVVLETGLGGNFDSTNVVKCPKACVITALGFDHTSILGNTMAEIAEAKAGIIKPGSRVVFYGEEPEGEAVIRRRCEELQVPLVLPEFAALTVEPGGLPQAGVRTQAGGLSEPGVLTQLGELLQERELPQAGELPEPGTLLDRCRKTDFLGENGFGDVGGNGEKVPYVLPKQRFSYKQWENLELSLPGKYQLKNAAVVLETIDVLKENGVPVSEDAVRRGLSEVYWQARLEVLAAKPLILVDGSHNPQGMRATVESLEKLFPGRKFTFVFGAMADKALEQMIPLFLPMARKVLTTAPALPRATGAEELAALCGRIAKEEGIACGIASCPTVREALLAIKKEPEDEIIVIIGSLYLAGEVKNLMKVRH